MISREANHLAHRQIIIDLTIRTLERDRKHIGDFKMRKAFELWFDAKIIELHGEVKRIKAELGKLGAKVHPGKSDGDFTIYTIVEHRKDFDLKYNNIALKNWCDDEVRRLLGLEYRK